MDNNFVVGAVLIDLSKAFDCIPHDLIIAKLSAYNFSDEALSWIYSYLTNRRQCVRINNTHSQLETIISGVPQGSILGPILFNLSINDLFFFVVLASLYNFADDNTLSAFATTVSGLIKILESESEVVIDWFKINKMVVNPDKFQAIILDKRKRDHTDEHITVANQQIKVVSSVKLCHLHISHICKSAANQLNALIRLKKFINFEEKKILINSYFMANFNYCPLVWMLSNANSLKKIANLQKRALRFLCNDYEISYEELLSKSSTSSMNIKRLRALCVELYKTINKLNPDFMRDLFKLRFTNRPVREKYKMNQKNLQKRALRFLCNDYEISYEELLSKSSTSSMNIKRLRALCVELYKTINKLNPDFMRDYFKLRFTNRPVREKYKMNMIIPEFSYYICKYICATFVL